MRRILKTNFEPVFKQLKKNLKLFRAFRERYREIRFFVDIGMKQILPVRDSRKF